MPIFFVCHISPYKQKLNIDIKSILAFPSLLFVIYPKLIVQASIVYGFTNMININ